MGIDYSATYTHIASVMPARTKEQAEFGRMVMAAVHLPKLSPIEIIRLNLIVAQNHLERISEYVDKLEKPRRRKRRGHK